MRIRLLLVVFAFVVAAGVAGVSSSSAHLVAKARAPGLDERARAQRVNLGHARYVCRRGRGPGKVWSCAARRWLERELGETLSAIALRDLLVVDQDWLEAVELAGRAFPGSASWLLSCSEARSEGGHGRFVWNGGALVEEADRVRARDRVLEISARGSGAGGWLQFLRGTFDRNVGRAFDEARAAGVRVPGRFRSWFSRVGQALTGASMLRHGQRGEWSGSGC